MRPIPAIKWYAAAARNWSPRNHSSDCAIVLFLTSWLRSKASPAAYDIFVYVFDTAHYRGRQYMDYASP